MDGWIDRRTLISFCPQRPEQDKKGDIQELNTVCKTPSSRGAGCPGGLAHQCTGLRDHSRSCPSLRRPFHAPQWRAALPNVMNAYTTSVYGFSLCQPDASSVLGDGKRSGDCLFKPLRDQNKYQKTRPSALFNASTAERK